MPDVYSIFTREGEAITNRANREEINRLRGLDENGRCPLKDDEGRPLHGPQLIFPGGRNKVWKVAPGVSVAVILAELRRSIYRTAAIADVNHTIDRERYSTPTRSGRLFQHHQRQCANWHPYAHEYLAAGLPIPAVRIEFAAKAA